MLFDSSIRKELSRSFGATLVVLVTVVMTMMLIKVLGQASRGSVNPSDVLLVMGYTVLGQLPTILSLCLFIAVVATLSRMYRDSEMAVWFSSGQSLVSFLRPLMRFSWPIMVVIAVLALLVWPWANQQIVQLRAQYEQRGDVDRIAPGEFQESSDGSRVFFIDRDRNSDLEASNVFIVTNEEKKDTVTTAKSAHLEVQENARVAVLNDGQRVEKTKDNPGLKVSDFKEYGTRIGSAATIDPNDMGAVKNIPTRQLMASEEPRLLGELGYRLGLAIAALNFVVLGLAMASVNPRAGRSSSLVFALFAFIVYYNLMTFAQNWVSSGKASLPLSFVLIHGLTALLAWTLLLSRNQQFSLLQWVRRKGSRA
ncbi:LPS export ABC transporter permease LptF [Comamonas sp. SY3]|uniref:LPS export ABC transporter permease LptF n=1 Tax=Comamonas sp. SY3 TaxID=3243601 RepID=UPI0035945F86